MTRDDEIRRGNEAKRLLGEPLLVEALATIRAEIEREWLAAPARDIEGRERLWMMRKLTDRLEGHLRSVAETGALAAKQVAEVEKKRKLFAL